MPISVSPQAPPSLRYHDGMIVNSVRDQWNYTILDLSVDAAVDIGGAGVPVELGEIYVDAALSAAAVPVQNGAGVTQWSIPASLAAGTALTWCKGMRFETGLRINSDDAATGTIVVKWRAI